MRNATDIDLLFRDTMISVLAWQINAPNAWAFSGMVVINAFFILLRMFKEKK